MELWTWLAQVIMDTLKARFDKLERQRDELAQMARDSHRDHANCQGAGRCQFCDKLKRILAE